MSDLAAAARPAGARLCEQLRMATKAIDSAASVLTILLLGFIVTANGLQILLRGLFEYSFLWLYEVNLLASSWLYFIGMALVYFRHKDITLDFVLMFIRGRARAIYLIAMNVIAIATFAVVGFYGVRLMELELPFRTTGDGIPEALFSAPVVLAMIIMSLILVQQSLEIGLTGEGGELLPEQDDEGE